MTLGTHGDEGTRGRPTPIENLDLGKSGVRGKVSIRLRTGEQSNELIWGRQPKDSITTASASNVFGETTRLTGPVQFLVRLLDFWRLKPRDAVGLLGFDRADAEHVSAILDGKEPFRGRDVRDRIAYLLSIRATLRSLFRDLEAENDWLREPHAVLRLETPMSLLLGGSMEDLLLVREYVDTVAGR